MSHDDCDEIVSVEDTIGGDEILKTIDDCFDLSESLLHLFRKSRLLLHVVYFCCQFMDFFPCPCQQLMIRMFHGRVFQQFLKKSQKLQ